ncbi:ABC transporter ATP-binding protein [Paenibacillus taichungensis]|uniref:ABC transporter ATP-binding protein n=1 Tax=Paenibacillus taichungensis TaxID=484184 RepID=UPI0038D0CED0
MVKQLLNKIKPLKSYGWALSFFRPYTRQIIYLLICGAVAILGEVLTPKLIQIIIDVVLPKQDVNLFFQLLGLLLLLNLFMILGKSKKNLLQRQIGEKASRDLQFSIFTKLRRLGLSHYEQKPAGETLSLFNTEINAVNDLYRNSLSGMIEHFLFVAISVSFMLSISPSLTLVMIPCFAAYYILGPYFEKKTAYYVKEQAKKRIIYGQYVYESLSGFRDFRSFNVQKWDHERSVSAFSEYYKKHSKFLIYGYARGSYRRFIFYAGAIALFCYGNYLLKEQLITVGGLVAFILLFLSAMFRLTLLVTMITEARMLVHQTEPLYNFYNLEEEVQEAKEPETIVDVRGDIVFDKVNFSYHGQEPIINDFNLHIKAGQKVAFVGASGCGKSTIFKLLGRFYESSSGIIAIDGISVNKLSLQQLRDTLGFVFQETFLFGTSIRENIRFGKPEASDEEIIEAAKAAYAHEFIVGMPDGYDTLLGDRGVTLSGGQRQRLSIARMFLKKPTIILLDEATSALDNVSEREVQTALNEFMSDKTTLVIAHRLTTIKDFDKIVFVHEGSVAEMGTYEELMSKQGLFNSLVNGQKQVNFAQEGDYSNHEEVF